MAFLRKIKIKHVLLLFVFLALVYFISIFFFSTEKNINYITAQVERGDITQTVLADGTISAFKQVSVGAQVSGQIKKLYVELGDEVKQGDMIAEIDDLKQNNDLKQAMAALNVLQAQRKAKEANLKNYQLTYERQLKLVNRGVGIQSDLDAALAQLDAIKADIAALDANIMSANIAVDTAQLNLGYTKITAPIDGIIVAIPVDEGQTVNSVQSAPTIVKVAQLDKMTVEAQISEADVINVKKGMPVYFTILGLPNKRFDGLILRDIEPAPDSINKEDNSLTTSTTNVAIYYNGLFDVDNPDLVLRISMSAQVYIVTDAANDVLFIPATAIEKNLSDNQAIVYVLDENQNIVEKKIKTGINNNIYIEVKAGLNEGDTVVTGRFDGSSVSKSGRGTRIRL